MRLVPKKSNQIISIQKKNWNSVSMVEFSFWDENMITYSANLNYNDIVFWKKKDKI